MTYFVEAFTFKPLDRAALREHLVELGAPGPDVLLAHLEDAIKIYRVMRDNASALSPLPAEVEREHLAIAKRAGELAELLRDLSPDAQCDLRSKFSPELIEALYSLTASASAAAVSYASRISKGRPKKAAPLYLACRLVELYPGNANIKTSRGSRFHKFAMLVFSAAGEGNHPDLSHVLKAAVEAITAEQARREQLNAP